MAAAKKPAAKKAATKTTTAAKPRAAPAPVREPEPTPAAAPAATTVPAYGFFDVPTIEKSPWGILALILNIIPGGVGTIIAGAKAASGGQIVKGIIQFVLLWTVLAWVWSIIDGVRIFRRAV